MILANSESILSFSSGKISASVESHRSLPSSTNWLASRERERLGVRAEMEAVLNRYRDILAGAPRAAGARGNDHAVFENRCGKRRQAEFSQIRSSVGLSDFGSVTRKRSKDKNQGASGK